MLGALPRAAKSQGGEDVLAGHRQVPNRMCDRLAPRPEVSCFCNTFARPQLCLLIFDWPADNPAHRRIVTQTFYVVHVLISGEMTEHRLTQQTDQRVAAVLARARVGECLARRLAQPECVVEFAVRQQSRFGRDPARSARPGRLSVACRLRGSSARSGYRSRCAVPVPDRTTRSVVGGDYAVVVALAVARLPVACGSSRSRHRQVATQVWARPRHQRTVPPARAERIQYRRYISPALRHRDNTYRA